MTAGNRVKSAETVVILLFTLRDVTNVSMYYDGNLNVHVVGVKLLFEAPKCLNRNQRQRTCTYRAEQDMCNEFKFLI